MTQSRSQEFDKIHRALIAARQAMPALAKDTQGQRSKYASLAAVFDTILDHLFANDVLVTQPTALLDNTVLVVRTMLVHSSGQWLEADYPIMRLSSNDNPMFAPSQAIGSAITYARRYALLGLCGLVAEDDDGQRASDEARSYASRTTPRRPQMPAASPMRNFPVDNSSHHAAASPSPNRPAASRGGSISPQNGPAPVPPRPNHQIDGYLASAAAKGMAELAIAWKNLSAEEQRLFEAAKERRFKPIAKAADAEHSPLSQGVLIPEETLEEEAMRLERERAEGEGEVDQEEMDFNPLRAG